MSKKKNPREVDLAMGGGRTLLSVIVKIVAAVVAAGGRLEQVHALDDNKPASTALLTQIAQLIAGKVAEPVIQVAWQLVLNFVIAACRFVSYVNSDINAANFPYAPGDLDLKEVIIVTINRMMSTEEVKRLLDEQGLRPARLIELLYWWLVNPEKQGNCLVAALGSVWYGRVPYVSGLDGLRKLRLHVAADVWGQRWGFAAVRKSAPTT